MHVGDGPVREFWGSMYALCLDAKTSRRSLANKKGLLFTCFLTLWQKEGHYFGYLGFLGEVYKTYGVICTKVFGKQ